MDMNLYFRLIAVIIASYFKPLLSDVLKGCRLGFHVLPNDLDTNMHMNNGRYLTIMDLGRMDLVLRTGLFRVMMKQKCIPVLSAVKMRYRMPLHLFEKYDLVTRVICWDDKWVYMEQRFVIAKGKRKGATAAIALLKGGFYDRVNKSTVPTQTLIDIVGMDQKSPPFPDYINQWQSAEKALRDVTAAEKLKKGKEEKAI